MERQFENIAFISYNHKDIKAAKSLMRKLDGFRLPSSMKKEYPDAPVKLRKIFRDQDELTPGHESLSEKIKNELRNTKFLIVVCSPNSAQSHWVNEEVSYFKEIGRTKYIIPYIIDGEPNSEDAAKECYVPELRSITDELYAVNIAENGDNHAQVKVIAGLLDVKFDQLWQRERRAERRKRITIITAVVLFALVALGVALWMWKMRNKTVEERNKVYIAQSRAVAEKVQNNLDKEDIVTCIAALLEVLPDSIEKPNRPFVGELYQALNVCDSYGLNGIFNHNERIEAASFDLKGERIVTASTDSTAKIWSVKTGELLKTIRHNNLVNSAEFSRDGKNLLTTSKHGPSVIWDATTGDTIMVSPEYNCFSGKFSPNGKSVFTESSSKLIVWDTETGKLLYEIPHDGALRFAKISPDNRYVMTKTKSKDDTIRVWSAMMGDLLNKIPVENGIAAAEFSPDGLFIGVASYDGAVTIWNINNDKPYQYKILLHNKSINDISFNKTGEYIVTASNDSTAKIWNVKTGKQIGNTLNHDESVRFVSFSHNDKYIVSGSEDCIVKIWGSKNGKLLKKIRPYGEANSAIFSPNCKYVLTTTNFLSPEKSTCIAKLWNINPTEHIFDTLYHITKIKSMSFSPDSKYLITTELLNDTAKIWDVRSGELSSMLIFNDNVEDAQYSPVDNKIVTVSKKGTFTRVANIWDVDMGCTIGEEIHLGSMMTETVKFSTDGKYIITIGYDSSIRIWDSNSGKLVDDSLLCRRLLNETVYSPNGKCLWLGNGRSMVSDKSLNLAVFGNKYVVKLGKSIITPRNKTVMIINAMTNELISEIWCDDNVNAISFSSDSRYVLISTYSNHIGIEDVGCVRICCVTNGECIFKEEGDYISVSPDMKTIAIARGNELIIKPFIEPQQLINKYRKMLKDYKLSTEDRKKYYLE